MHVDGFPLLNPVSWFVKSLPNLNSEYCLVVIMGYCGWPCFLTQCKPCWAAWVLHVLSTIVMYYRLVNELYHVYIYILYDMDGHTVKLHTLYIHRDGSIVGSDFSAV